MSQPANGETTHPWSGARDLALTAWDLHRTRNQRGDSARARVITLRTQRRLLAAYEAQRGIPTEERSQLLICENAQDACLLLPGVRSTAATLTPLAQQLHEGGLTVQVQNLPGLEAAEDGIQLPLWRANLLVARRCFLQLAQLHRRVHVVGYSFGACLALMLAQREPVSRLVLLAPALIPRVSVGQRLLLAVKAHRVPWLRRRMGWNADLLEGMDKAKGAVSHLRMPIYAAQSDDDERIAPESLRYLQKKARNQTSRFQVFPAGGHAVLDAHGSAVLHREVQRFLAGAS